MYINCILARAFFPAEGFQVVNDKPVPLLWDCHHGDTFVLMVKKLLAEPFSGEAPAEPVALELSLAPFTEVHSAMAGFAVSHNLPLAPLAPLPEALEEPLTLAASHLPGPGLFIYCENATLTFGATPAGNLHLGIKGGFKSRKVPSKEIDLLIHLERPGAARLLSYCFSLVRGRL